MNFDDPRTLKEALNQEPIYCTLKKTLELENRSKIQIGVMIEVIARFAQE